jgi:hypothetical protein
MILRQTHPTNLSVGGLQGGPSSRLGVVSLRMKVSDRWEMRIPREEPHTALAELLARVSTQET